VAVSDVSRETVPGVVREWQLEITDPSGNVYTLGPLVLAGDDAPPVVMPLGRGWRFVVATRERRVVVTPWQAAAPPRPPAIVR